jgi:hypothetical protein
MPVSLAASASNKDRGAIIPIATYTSLGLNAVADFTNIPQNFQDLMIVVNGRATWNATNTTFSVYLNNAIFGLTSTTQMSSDGATITNGRTTNGSFGTPGTIPALGASDSSMATSVVHILNYKTSYWKTILVRSGYELGSTGILEFNVGLYQDTSPTTRVQIATNGSFYYGSTVTLYGVRAAS